MRNQNLPNFSMESSLFFSNDNTTDDNKATNSVFSNQIPQLSLLTREELIRMVQQENFRSKSQQAINEALILEMQKIQSSIEEKTESYRINFSQCIQQMRSGYLTQNQIYIKKLSCYEQEIRVLCDRISIMHKQLSTKQDKIQILQKTIQLLVEEKPKVNDSRSKESCIEGSVQLKSLIKTANQLNIAEKQIEGLRFEKNELKENLQKKQAQVGGLTHKIALVSKQFEGLKIQLCYCKEQNEQIMEENKKMALLIQNLKQKVSSTQKQLEQRTKQTHQLMINRINLKNTKIKELEEQNQRMRIQIDCQRNKQIQMNSLLNDYAQKTSWYENLLKEARGNFVYSELMKENQVINVKKQNQVLKKELEKMKSQFSLTNLDHNRSNNGFLSENDNSVNRRKSSHKALGAGTPNRMEKKSQIKCKDINKNIKADQAKFGNLSISLNKIIEKKGRDSFRGENVKKRQEQMVEEEKVQIE